MAPSSDAEPEWDSSAYDDAHSFVYEYGADVLDLLEPTPDERVLDLGCGTGHLTGQVAEAGPAVVGLDRSPEMLATARETYPDCAFVRADAREFAFAEPFDAVFSNAALHWIRDQDAVLESVADALGPGGRFVAELGGTGNVAAIVDAVEAELERRGYVAENPWYFPSVGEYASRLEAHGFEVRYARLFDRPTELDAGAEGLAAWLELFGDDLLAAVPDDERGSVVAAVENDLREDLFVDGTWVADYRRLRVVAVRSDGR
ncbi:class I SAM-dependent methyltransferase [Natrarchaeobaculum sulfurireducens]|uniref:SAM-dependent methyltransferase n=1 Tax=Natrarchaeobaculum sulfurireducens TaxID=2044521 RepID=A0A346PI24_9EURY|nr:methyltransferase domain-containing protein [Natrarchaeobaculum sulfurireducens]AXR79169.1 SAM-dependent methyltransferase [Natrarchaeobaculum sulfurireducens]AXR80968.1 Trans-aconitate 2-methyltransferase [Natrarchaeobaculum sulfurireducens]